MSKKDTQISDKISYKALGMALGMLFGGVVGLIIDNPIIFAGGGMVIGLALGTTLDRRYEENNPYNRD